jgi:hypothetical protein
VSLVRFAHEPFQAAIDVCERRQSKMNAVPETAERFNSNHSRMIDTAREPERGLEPVAMNHGSSKTHAGLKDDPRLLGVHGQRTARPRDCPPSVEQLTHERGTVPKVIGQRVAPT